MFHPYSVTSINRIHRYLPSNITSSLFPSIGFPNFVACFPMSRLVGAWPVHLLEEIPGLHRRDGRPEQPRGEGPKTTRGEGPQTTRPYTGVKVDGTGTTMYWFIIRLVFIPTFWGLAMYVDHGVIISWIWMWKKYSNEKSCKVHSN